MSTDPKNTELRDDELEGVAGGDGSVDPTEKPTAPHFRYPNLEASEGD